jgi:hypothetical protein
MDALTAQSIRGLRSRLEASRPRGLVPALMAEFRLDAPDEDRQPLAGFEPKWQSVSRCRLPNGADVGRAVWLGGDSEEFRNFCTDAARAALPTIRAAGYAVGLGAPNPRESWLWAMFELAALRLPGTYLRLADNDVLRACAPEITITETVLRSIDSGDPLFPLAAAAGQTRYWRLASAVEASVAVLDLAESVMPSPAPPTPPPPQLVAATTGRRRSTRSTAKIDVDGPLGKLETKMRRELVKELGSEAAAGVALGERLYSLSAEELAPMLKRVGCKTSGKTIRRNSEKYDSWESYRRPSAAAAVDVDVGPAYSASRLDGEDSAEDGGEDSPPHLESGRRPRASDAAEDAVYSGHLSRRTGGRGIARIGKTAAEKAAEDEADRFAREAGVDLPPAE